MNLREKEEVRRKITMVMEGIDKPATARALSQHPLLEGMLSSKSVAMHLLTLSRQKMVRRLRDNTWVLMTKKDVVSAASNAPTNPFFVINIKTQSISLDVGGLRLPVRVE